MRFKNRRVYWVIILTVVEYAVEVVSIMTVASRIFLVSHRIFVKKKRMREVQMKQLLFSFHYLCDGSVLLH